MLTLSLNNSEANYFLYYHQSNTTFRVYEVITTGYVHGQATPIVNSTLDATITLNKYLIEQKEVELSYSQNLLHSLNTGAKVSVTVNNNSVGVLDTHQAVKQLELLGAFCRQRVAIAEEEKRPDRRVRGDPTQRVEHVIDLSRGIMGLAVEPGDQLIR